MTLIKSISGIRGTIGGKVGEGLSPLDAVRFSAAYGTWMLKRCQKKSPVVGVEIAENIYKFDYPFLGDKYTLETTLKTFEQNHPELKVNYIYTGPSELNTKKKTHMLLYIFTEKVTK